MIDGFETRTFKIGRIDIKEEGFKPEDGGDLKIPVNQCFADEMTVVIKETKENLNYIRQFVAALINSSP